MIYFNLPDFGDSAISIYTKLVQLNQQTPDIFYPNTGIDCLYDCPNGCIWMGGGICYSDGGIDLIKMKDTMDYLYEELHIPICLTFSNPTIETIEECMDEECNKLAELCERSYNQIMVSSSILEDYLRKNYPEYKINKSIIASEIQNCEFDKYNKIVLSRRLNHDFDFLLNIEPKNRNKIEFLCRSTCPSNCPYTYSHYISTGIKQKQKQKFTDDDLPMCCADRLLFSSLNELNDSSTIIRQDLDLTYERLGFSQFKLSGRRSTWAICTNIVDYMILPCYQKDILRYLLNDYIIYK